MKDRWNALTECPKCRVVMRKKAFKMMGFDVRGWECGRCKENIYIGDDLNKVLVYNKLKNGIPVKIGTLGSSLVMRIPKEVSEVLGIQKGKEIILKVRDNELVVGV